MTIDPSQNGTPRPAAPPDLGQYNKPQIALNEDQFRRLELTLHNQVENAATMSRQFFNQVFDQRRDIDDECGYPRSASQITLDTYRELYDREPIPNRVVQVMPKESWQQSPLVYEKEDQEQATEFEKAWDELEVSHQGSSSWHQDEQGGTIWEYLFRGDMLSGIGHFGVILLGFDDGKNLQDPVDGVVTTNKWKREPVYRDFTVPRRDKLTGLIVANAAGVKLTDTVRRRVATRMVPNGKQTIPEDSPYTDRERKAFTDLLTQKQITVNTNPLKVLREGETPTTATHEVLYLNTPFPTEPTDNKDAARPPARPGAGQGRTAPGSGTGSDHEAADLYSGTGAAGSSMGTDQAYMGVQFGPGEALADKPAGSGLKLMFMRPYDETLVQIVRYEWNVRSPRFGLPTMYRITLNDPREQHSGIGLPLATVFVHWSRVIHLADNLGSSEIFGVPRQRPVLNRLLDLRKIYGADGEAFWKNALMKLFFETHPQMGGDVDVDTTAMKGQLEQMLNGLQQYMITIGMTAKTVAPAVVDPTPHVNVHLEAICIQLGIPIRVFKGSERGELASSQDDASWNDRVRHRQHMYLTPRVVCPLVDRLISVGVLPEPEGYTVEWPDMDSTTEADKASVGGTRMTALAAYVQGNLETIITPEDCLVHILGFKEETAKSIVENAKQHQDETMTMPPAGDPAHPASESPEPPPPPMQQVQPGHSLADPATGAIKSTAPGKPPAPVVAGPSQIKPPSKAGQPAKPGAVSAPPAAAGKPPTANAAAADGAEDVEFVRNDDADCQWITVRGQHICIQKGETGRMAVARHFAALKEKSGKAAAHADHLAHGVEHAGHAAHHAHEAAEVAEGLGDLHGDAVAIMAKHAVGPTIRAVSTLMRQSETTARAGHALAALHDKTSAIMQAAVVRLKARYGPATAAAIVGGGALLHHSITHAMGPVGLGLKAVPGSHLVSAVPLLALAEAGKQAGLVGHDSRLERHLTKVGTVIHAVKHAAAAATGRIGAAGLAAARGAGKALGTALGTRNAADVCTLNADELAAARAEFVAEIKAGFAAALAEHAADLEGRGTDDLAALVGGVDADGPAEATGSRP